MTAGTDAFDPLAARDHLLAEHRDPLATVLDCADAVAAGWEGGATTDPDAVRGPLRAALDRAGVFERLPDLLVTAVRAGGGGLRGRPVAAAPYVTVTSRGPVLRGTLDPGRLVVSLGVFAVGRAPVRYTRSARRVKDALTVELVTD
jgi:hypothetical protein